ncbi:MAG: tetratricopeptide repeat protein [Bdellovibrionales bacterium]
MFIKRHKSAVYLINLSLVLAFFTAGAYADRTIRNRRVPAKVCPEALNAGEVVFESRAEEISWLISEARRARYDKDIHLELRYLLRLLELDPNDARTHTQIARVYKKLGDPDKALEHYQSTVSLEGATARNLMNILGVTLQSRNWPVALDTSVQALELYPDDKWLLGRVTQVLLGMGRLDEALDVADQLIALDPENAVAHGLKAQVLLALDRPEEALSIANQMIASNPRNPTPYGLKIQALLALGRLDEALTAVNRRIARSPGDAVAYGLKMQVLVALGRLDEALSTADHRIALDPGDIVALGLRAQVLLALGRLEETLNALNQLTALDPKDTVTFVLKTQVLLDLGRLDEALTTADQLILLDPKNPVAQGLKTQALLALGRLDEALNLAQSLEHPFFRNYYEALAWMGKSELDRAEALLKTLRQDRAVLWKLAQLSFAKGNFSAARDSLIQLLQVPSLKADLWCIIALVKIEQMGDFEKSPILEGVLRKAGPAEADRLSVLARQLNWEFITQEASKEIGHRSFLNPFWKRLHDRPVDSFTRRSTWSARIP